ncbi:hypothetical protein EJ02DRAFT_514304 [Clathrospora elynae]|uniref:Uncharacterized protein n=1 Tax=Clathrospora elynae TaxID=706981 RepID=A0A6A5SGJ0_9PLEO|nr:hypothetical protein EJ02DRAFT_514304 [Clathrospora elynae]
MAQVPYSLLNISSQPVYQEYIALIRLPEDAPELGQEKKGSTGYVLYPGEIFCQAFWDKELGQRCGQRFNERAALSNHVKKFHKNYTCAGRPNGRPGYQAHLEAIAFYRNLLRPAPPPPEQVPNELPTRPAKGKDAPAPTIPVAPLALTEPIANTSETDLSRGRRPVVADRVLATQPNKHATNTSRTRSVSLRKRKQVSFAEEPVPDKLEVPLYKANNPKRG